MNRESPVWLWLAFPAIAMSLGWALRGFIGGGPLGAMIPGAMVGLTLCGLLDLEADAALVGAFAAVGVGFGGEMTYGQTVGLSLQPETYWWALLGFAIKGGAWGLLGGAMTGLAFSRERYRTADLIAAVAFLPAATWVGWKLVNEPKLIYFSNRMDRPRAEVWAGLILAGLVMLGWLALRSQARLAHSFGIWGAMGGAAGFALGAAIQVWGQPLVPKLPLGWWKVMELTFGAVFGLSLGFAAWRSRESLMRPRALPPATLPIAGALIMAAVAIAPSILLEGVLHTRFNFVLTGAGLLLLALWSRTLCWQIAITLPCYAFALDLLENKPHLPLYPMWGVVGGLTLASVAMTSQLPRMRPMLLWITWTAVAVSLVKSFVPWHSEPIMMETLFVLMACLVSRWTVRSGLPHT